VDSAESTAQVVAEQLAKLGLSRAHSPASASRLRFFATDSVEKFRRLGARFLGHAIDDVQHIDLKE
jgi:glutamate racemase